MKMSNNPVKYKVLIKQYVRSILDRSALVRVAVTSDQCLRIEFLVILEAGGTICHLP